MDKLSMDKLSMYKLSMDKNKSHKLNTISKKDKKYIKNNIDFIFQNRIKSYKNQYYGPIENVKLYLDNQFKVIKFINIIIKIINKVYKYYDIDKDHIWLVIRCSENYICKNTRWHMDGRYYKDELPHSKFIATLYGPSTYAIDTNEQDREELRNIYKEFYEWEINTQLANKFDHRKKNINHSIILVGKDGIIHSEPLSLEPVKRIFISILFGTKDQIDEWQNK